MDPFSFDPFSVQNHYYKLQFATCTCPQSSSIHSTYEASSPLTCDMCMHLVGQYLQILEDHFAGVPLLFKPCETTAVVDISQVLMRMKRIIQSQFQAL